METTREETIEQFRRWLADATTWIGVFENHDMSSRDCGRRLAYSFDTSIWDEATVGLDYAPDGSGHGLGWRYILIGKFRGLLPTDLDEAIAAFYGEKESADVTR